MKNLKCLITSAHCHLIIWAASKPRQSPEGKTEKTHAVIANLYMNLFIVLSFLFFFNMWLFLSSAGRSLASSVLRESQSSHICRRKLTEVTSFIFVHILITNSREAKPITRSPTFPVSLRWSGADRKEVRPEAGAVMPGYYSAPETSQVLLVILVIM